jgi:primosomal protein N' (replication factor Y)
MYGPGVEKVFEELKSIFPNKTIRIFSSDYLIKKKRAEKLITEVSEEKIDILVGTQMISKGFNFPKLNCIVVVDADFTGKGFDLRSTEKNIQLYNQLSGRAGRFSKDSIIIYQTINPDNQTLKNILENKIEIFFSNELKIRKANNLPPFFRLISLIISATSQENSYQGAIEIKKRIEKLNHIQILGPVDSPIFKKNKKFRTRLLIRSESKNMCQKPLAEVLENLKISSKIKLTVDVDPINFT